MMNEIGLFDSIFGGTTMMKTVDSGQSKIRWDVDAQNIYVETLVPAVSPDSIKINFQDGVLSISGKTVETKLFKARDIKHTLQVNEEIDSDNISAEYTHGILRLTLPKAERVKPKLIEVKVN